MIIQPAHFACLSRHTEFPHEPDGARKTKSKGAFSSRPRLVATAALLGFCAWIGHASAQSSTIGTGVVRHGLTISGSNRVEGSLQILTGETVNFGGAPVVTGDLLVPGTPAIQFSGSPNYGGTLQGSGSAQPANYLISGTGNFSLRHVITRTNPVTLAPVPAPPQPSGTRDVTLSSAAESAGNFATIRNLTLNGASGNLAVPPGTYGTFTINGNNSLTLGVAGATEPSVYNFQQLVFSGRNELRVIGPVILTVNGSVVANGRFGSSPNPAWLKLRLSAGDFRLGGNNTLYGEVIVPNGLVRFDGNSELIGGLGCDRLILDGNNLLRFLVLNSAPVATNQSVVTPEDTAKAIVLSGTDPDNQVLTFTLLSQPAHGVLSGAMPNLIYTPATDYHGSDSFTFKTNDGQADSNVATVSIAVTPVNDRPDANGQTLTTEEDISVPLTLSGRDVDGDSLTYRIVSGPAHGALSGIAPQLIYTPAQNYNQTDSFTFVANDGVADSAPATVSIQVGPINDPPAAFNQSVSTDEDTALAVVLAGADDDGDALTYRVMTTPQHGSLSGTEPNLIYTPDLNYNGPDSFSYRASDSLEDSALATVLVMVKPVNDAPTAAEQNICTTEDTDRPVTLSGGDVDGNAITFSVVLPPAHGTILGVPPNLVYRPNHDYNGTDSFTFKTNDGSLDSQVATIGITITPVNDSPVAEAQNLTTNEDTLLAITLSAPDPEGDQLSYAVVQSPQHGQLSGAGENLVYTPAADYYGPDSFTFKARDAAADSQVAIVQIDVIPVNDPPKADNQSVTTEEDTAREIVLTGADIDSQALGFHVVVYPSHGSITGTAPFLTYTPAPNYFGPDSFTFVANDGMADSAAATVSIDVGTINDAPVTYNQNVATDEDVALDVALWADEYDGDPVSFSIVTAPHHGTLSGANGEQTYTPDLNYNGPDSFSFKANDGQEDSNVSVVSITVRPVNDAPVAAAQNRIMPEDTTLPVVLSAADVDGDALTYAIVMSPTHGTLSGAPPNLTYAPAANFNEVDTFTFIANDGTVDSSVATVTITVQPVNDLAVADAQSLVTDEEVPLDLTLTGTDVDGDPLTYFVVTSPEHGTLTGTPPHLTYTPLRDFNGWDRILFAINDGTSDSLPAEIRILVRPVNDAPLVDAGPDQAITYPGLASLIGSARDDGDPVGSSVSVSWSQISGPGVVTFQTANGLETRAAFSAPGVYVLRLSATDSELSSSDDITITVSPENHRPVVDAGPDQTVALPATPVMVGSVTDDGNPAGKTLITAWSVVSGPAPVTFSDRNSVSTTVAFSAVGSYTLRLTASDSELTKSDDVVVTVVPHNSPPVVNAGGNKTVELTDSLPLAGLATDDGLPAGSNLVVGWTALSGPGDVIFGDATAATTTAQFSKPGTYLLRLSANDSLLTTNDEISITVIRSNRAPTVNAGADQTLNLYNIAALSGVVTDDGLPQDTTSVSWTKVSGPGNVVFSAVNAATTSATFTKTGTYILRLTADDSELTGFDEVVVTANFQNQAPEVAAGPDQTGLVQTPVVLSGRATDDGVPADVPLVVTWSKVSGPGTATFADPNADATSVTFSAAGTYVLQFTASDSELSASDQLTVQVALPCLAAPASLVGFWPGDGDAQDKVGGSNGVLVNGAGFAPGMVNNAFSLNGTNSVKVPATSATNVGAGNGLTVELWMNPTDLTQSHPVVEWNNGSTIGAHFWVSVTGQGSLYANLIDTGGGTHSFTTPAGILIPGIFQHVALTYDKTTGIAALYKNGSLVTQQNLGVFTPRTGYDMLIGERPGYHFNGKLDEVSLYSRALRVEEILSIYQAGSGGKCRDNFNLNHPPVVSAGPDVTIPLSYSLTLKGSATDDGLPTGGALTTNWTRVSGPGTAAFTDASSPVSSVAFSVAGTYVLRLSASDSEVTTTSDVTITVVADNTTVPNTVTITPFQATDWRYKVYPYGTVPADVGALTFDDSSYALGRGAFGSGGGCAVQSTVHTNWPVNTEIVLRRIVDLPTNVTNVRVSGTVDNDVQVLINGVAASGFITHEGCAQLDDTRINVVTTSLVPGKNLFVVRGRDRGAESFVDVRLLVDQPIVANAGPNATVAGGTLVSLDGSQSSAFSGSPLTYQWTQASGPAVALDSSDPVHPRFIAPALSTSTVLTFRLIVNDGLVTSTPATVAITVLPSSVVNHAPTVDAGLDQTLISSTATLNGTIQDDGLPSNSVKTKWTAVSGPGAVTFANANLPSTTAQFTRPGSYVLRLSADDSQLLASDTVTISVPAGVNLPPSVNAGPDRVITSGNTAPLAAIVSDDGLPNGILVAHWNEVSGPGLVTFANAYAASTTATFPVPGTYVLRVTGSDSAMSATDDVTITVAGVNQPPQVNAGVDQTISVHNSATLAGTATDDGLPSGILNFRWSGVSGPGSVSFAVVNDNVTATFGEAGTYVLRFTVGDSDLSASDDVTIQVIGDNLAPVVLAGPNQTVRQANAANLTGTVSDDGLPLGSALTVTWQQLSGPGTTTFGNPAAIATTASFPAAGTYVLQLSATDGALTTNSTTTVTVTSAVNLPPGVNITSPVDQSRALANAPISLAATASDSDGNIAKVTFFVNGANVGEKTQSPYSVSWNAGAAGTYTINAVATDNEGATASSAPVSIELVNNSSAPPVVDLLTPQDGDVITAPTAITGTIETTVLRSYLLQYRQKNQPCADWVTFASGTGAVTASTLGIFDPTLLLNGTYEIRLLVTTLSGSSYVLERNVVVDGNMKVGPFTATFKDLELPLSGVPISVTRTYDSRNHCPGDFGYGWTLDVDSIRIESSETLGNAWSMFVYEGNLFDPSYYRMDDAGPHLLSVKLPDGQLLRFTPKIIMDRSYNRLASLLDQDGDDIGQVYAPIGYNQPVKLIYHAQSGTNGAVLKARGYRTTNDVGSSGSIAATAPFYLSENTEGAFYLATRENSALDAPVMTDVSGWELTLKDGRVFLFDAGGKLEQMLDRVGNKVTFNRDGAGKIDRISHTPSGKEIVFHRDGSSRIDSITDPAGNAAYYSYTSNGDLDSYFARGNDPANNVPTTRFTYKGLTHLLENILDARGIQAAKNYYDDSGRLIRTVDADGKETVFTHDLNSRTETIKDRAGNITVHRYDERGNIIETRAPNGTLATTEYHRWSDGKLSDLKETESVTGLFTDEANPAGPLVARTLTTHYSYEDEDPNTPPTNDGLLRKLVDPKGNKTTFTYDECGNMLTVTDANANAAGGAPSASVNNTYYSNGLLQTASDALGHVTTYTYDAKGNPDTETRTVTITNVDGTPNLVTVVTDRDYNALGQLEKLTDAAGHVTTYEYDTNGNRRFERTTRTDGNATVAVVTEAEYDAQDRPVRTWNADNPRTQATRPSSETVYDENGKVAWTYDALGRGTHQEYDSRGLLAKTTHPDNTFETVTYDAEGRRDISTDRRGMAAQTIYDAMGRVKNTIFLGDGSTGAITLSTMAYDAAGRAWQSTDANGHTTTYTYNGAGQRIAVTQPAAGNTPATVTGYSYDANGNLRFVTDPKGFVTEYRYDALNRRTTTILPSAPLDSNGDGVIGSGEQNVAGTLVAGYDEMGRKASETDASNRTKRYGYDVLGRLRHVIDFTGHATRFEYDELGNQLSQTDANNHTTRYSYDNAGRRLTRTLPLGQQELLGYDPAGNLESRKDFNGRVTTFQYDAMNRLRFRFPDASLGEPTIQFTYNANGQRETMRDLSGTTVYGYDARGQLDGKQTPFGTLSYAYWPNGSLKQMWSSNANGINVSYTYDAVNRLDTVVDANAGTTSYGYDRNGNLESVAYPNGVSHSYDYNALNRLTLLSLAGSNGALTSYGYVGTPSGQRTGVAEGNGRNATYGYDALGRLQGESISGAADGRNGAVSYGYDNVGNRLTRTSSLFGIANQSFGYDANDRLNGDQYDNNGNTRNAPVSQPSALNSQQLLGTDSYDSENRLIQRSGTLNSQPSTINITYDGDGNRVQEIVNGQMIRYLVDDRNPTGYAQVVEEIVNGAVNHTYTYGHDLISQDQIDPATNSWHASFYAYDGHGNIRSLTNESGLVTDTYVYDAFGTLITATGTTNNRYLYSGEQLDPNLGLYYLRARLMNPLTGRFWSMDSYEGSQNDPLSLHKYLYANADPTNRVDPSGNWTLGEVIQTAAIIAMRAAAPTMRYSAYTMFISASVYFLTGSLIGIEDAYFGGAPEYLYTFRDVSGTVLFIAASVYEAASGIAPPDLRTPSRIPTKKIYVSPKKYPQSAQHIQEAQNAGKPAIVQAKRDGSVERRRQALQNTKTMPAMDRDEYPPAMFEEGGTGASVQYVKPSDNRGAGASVGRQMRGVNDGEYVEIVVGEPPM